MPANGRRDWIRRLKVKPYWNCMVLNWTAFTFGRGSIRNWNRRVVLQRSILITKPTRCTKISNLFWNRTLHVSDSFSVHHKESSTVHTTIGICHTGFGDCLLAGSWSRQQAVSKTSVTYTRWFKYDRDWFFFFVTIIAHHSSNSQTGLNRF